MRIYSVSLLAFSRLDDGTATGGTYVEQIPALIQAESIQSAGQQAGEQALNRWKVDEGWYGHQADVLPVTKAFYDAAFEAQRLGIVNLEEEEPLTFKF